MRLVDLNSVFLSAGGAGVTRDGEPVPERRGVGVQFDCPCGCDSPCFVPFSNPIDGGPPHDEPRGWKRTGDTLETLTLEPSILRSKPFGCGWHGWIRNGEIVNA